MRILLHQSLSSRELRRAFFNLHPQQAKALADGCIAGAAVIHGESDCGLPNNRKIIALNCDAQVFCTNRFLPASCDVRIFSPHLQQTKALADGCTAGAAGCTANRAAGYSLSGSNRP
jgi:hypothetical protein